jgi:hypothetical protein
MMFLFCSTINQALSMWLATHFEDIPRLSG